MTAAEGAEPRADDAPPQLGRGMARRGILLYGARISYGALLLLASVLISRLYGAYGLGQYTLLLTITNLAGIIGTFGMGTLVVERYAHYRDDPAGRASMLRGSTRTVLLTGSVATAVALGVSALLLPGLWWAAVTVLPISLSTLYLGYLVAQRRQLLSAALESLFRPALFIVSLLVLGLLLNAPSGTTIGWSLTISLTVLTCASGFACLRGAPRATRRRRRARSALLPAAGASYMVIALLTAAGQQLDRFVVQAIGTTADLGLYASAQNIMNIVTYAMLALMSLLLPATADYYAGKMSKAAFVARAKIVARGLTALALAVLVVCVFLGPWLLSVFGPEFRTAHTALIILAVGQLAAAACGPGTTVLSMGPYRSAAVWITATSVALNIAAAVPLVAAFGFEGAATANGLALVYNRLAGHIVARRRLGLNLSVL